MFKIVAINSKCSKPSKFRALLNCTKFFAVILTLCFLDVAERFRSDLTLGASLSLPVISLNTVSNALTSMKSISFEYTVLVLCTIAIQRCYLKSLFKNTRYDQAKFGQRIRFNHTKALAGSNRINVRIIPDK